jgi:hypothetical protein
MKQHAQKFPDEMVEYFESYWSVEELWSLSIPIEVAPTESFLWHLDHPFWSTCQEVALFDLSPQTVLNRAADFSFHHNRISNADINHPVEVAEFGSTLVVLDGIHRLARLSQLGSIRLQFRLIPRNALKNTKP